MTTRLLGQGIAEVNRRRHDQVPPPNVPAPSRVPREVSLLCQHVCSLAVLFKISAETAHDSYGAWREGAHDALVRAVALALWGARRWGWWRSTTPEDTERMLKILAGAVVPTPWSDRPRDDERTITDLKTGETQSARRRLERGELPW